MLTPLVVDGLATDEMSYAVKGKYEVIRMLRNSILLGLSAMGLAGIECMEFAQPLIQSADRVVLIKNSGQQRVGWQRQRYGSSDGVDVKFLQWIEEQKWELTVVMKRDGQKVTEDTVTAEDVATLLISWFNGLDGIASFREHDCANLFVQPSDVKPYKDDSQTYQNTASFTLVLHVPKCMTLKQDMATPVFEGSLGV